MNNQEIVIAEAMGYSIIDGNASIKELAKQAINRYEVDEKLPIDGLEYAAGGVTISPEEDLKKK